MRSQLPGTYGFGRTGDRTHSQMADQSVEMETRVGLWRQPMRRLRLKEDMQTQGVARQEIQRNLLLLDCANSNCA